MLVLRRNGSARAALSHRGVRPRTYAARHSPRPIELKGTRSATRESMSGSSSAGSLSPRTSARRSASACDGWPRRNHAGSTSPPSRRSEGTAHSSSRAAIRETRVREMPGGDSFQTSGQ
eukprot:scaffold111955_cov36-Tisochrysis_lutea.AAC.2